MIVEPTSFNFSLHRCPWFMFPWANIQTRRSIWKFDCICVCIYSTVCWSIYWSNRSNFEKICHLHVAEPRRRFHPGAQFCTVTHFSAVVSVWLQQLTRFPKPVDLTVGPDYPDIQSEQCPTWKMNEADWTFLEVLHLNLTVGVFTFQSFKNSLNLL